MSMAIARRKRLAQSPLARYERMAEIRRLEETVNDLFASGAVHGTTHLCQGQEALAVALATELKINDIVVATYRGHGIALALGMTVESVLAEILGKSTGCTAGVGGSMHLTNDEVGLLPTSAIIGGGLPIAAGAALAFQVGGDDRIAVAVFGDGATNIGAFHETLNLASIWRLPVVFICDNNVYGEYSRIDVTTPLEDLHLRASAYAMPGVVVDGMDVDAVRSVLKTAFDRARRGEGPTLVEAKTYRFAGHSRADTAPYRPEGELDTWQKRDPLTLARAAIIANGDADEARIKDVHAQVDQEIAEALARVRESPDALVADMFRNVWAAQVRAS